MFAGWIYTISKKGNDTITHNCLTLKLLMLMLGVARKSTCCMFKQVKHLITLALLFVQRQT